MLNPEKRAAITAIQEAQEALAGEDTVEWARKAKGSSMSLPWIMEILDDLIEDYREEEADGEDVA